MWLLVLTHRRDTGWQEGPEPQKVQHKKLPSESRYTPRHFDALVDGFRLPDANLTHIRSEATANLPRVSTRSTSSHHDSSSGLCSTTWTSATLNPQLARGWHQHSIKHWQETPRSLSKQCRKRRKVMKSGGKCTEAHFQRPEVHFPEVKWP